MAHSLTWVADELAKLHCDLEAIRERRRVAEQSAAMSADMPGKPTRQDYTEAKAGDHEQR